jgi:hypothetical protein
MNVPFTGAGKASVAAVQSILNKSPEGIPIPPLHPIINNDTLKPEEKQLIGDWSFYNKQIGNLSEFPYPIVLKNMRAYYRDSSRAFYATKPFLFLRPADTIREVITILSFSPNEILVSANGIKPNSIVLQQNYYPHWYYSQRKTINKVKKEGINFMSANLEQNKNTIRFMFHPALIKWMMLLSVISILTGVICLIFLKPK